MRFGAFVPQGWRLDLVGVDAADQWPTIKDVAQRLEGNGFEAVWVYDHFHTVPVATQEPTYEAWSLMAALAAATDRVRLGQMCTCNEYRPPAYLAKVAASIDQISGGRLEMGIGAGWYEAEFVGYGYSFDKPAARIARLTEAVEVIKALWTEEVVDYEGDHYRLRGGICRPKPAQQPHIPIWIAGGGEQLTLRTVARHAAYANFGQTIENFNRKSEILARHCQEVGREFDDIVRSANFNVLIAPDEGDVADRLRWYRERLSRFLPEDRVNRSIRLNFIESGGVAGTPEQVIEYLKVWEAAGCDYAICYFPDAAHDRASLDLFADAVIPALA